MHLKECCRLGLAVPNSRRSDSSASGQFITLVSLFVINAALPVALTNEVEPRAGIIMLALPILILACLERILFGWVDLNSSAISIPMWGIGMLYKTTAKLSKSKAAPPNGHYKVMVIPSTM